MLAAPDLFQADSCLVATSSATRGKSRRLHTAASSSGKRQRRSSRSSRSSRSRRKKGIGINNSNNATSTTSTFASFSLLDLLFLRFLLPGPQPLPRRPLARIELPAGLLCLGTAQLSHDLRARGPQGAAKAGCRGLCSAALDELCRWCYGCSVLAFFFLFSPASEH
jgi:hypothetical protein